MIPYGRQDINRDDINAVVNVLQSDWLTQGPAVPLFEKTVAQYAGVDYAIAINSATSALHIACLALGVGAGDYVWTSPNTFVASANCALYCGAKVDFVDIDPNTYNLSPSQLRKKLANSKNEGKLPKLVIVVHLAGQSCEMEEISKLSKEYGFKVIEDASHAIGGSYLEHKIGGCQFSDITVFSFHPVKIITTGEGGMATTNNPELAKKMQLFRSHGITSALDDMDPRPSHQIWNYQQVELGFNYRMTDLQAALGISQMKRIDSFVEKRHQIANRYNQELKDLPLTLPFQNSDTYSSFHLYLIRLQTDRAKLSQKELYQSMLESNIRVNIHYIPVYLQPYFKNLGFKPGHSPEAEKYYEEVLSIPMYPSLSTIEQDFVINTLRNLLG
ncbi:WecE Predicted pyridoxal phosphate-dependent enzyme apparently involved in regulation of cell wall biogenesis [Burkholderiaceae bacterium]